MRTGVHLVLIDNIKLHKNSDGTPQLTSTGEGLITVTYANTANQKIDKTYLIGNEKQKTFDKTMFNAGINTTENPSVKAAIGKRLYVAIREELEYNENGEQIEETKYCVFKSFPYTEGGRKPNMMGDPENGDVASGEFVKITQSAYKDAPFTI